MIDHPRRLRQRGKAFESRLTPFFRRSGDSKHASKTGKTNKLNEKKCLFQHISKIYGGAEFAAQFVKHIFVVVR